MAGDFEWNGDFFAKQSVGRRGNIFQNKIGNRCFATDADGEDRNVLFAITRGCAERRFAELQSPSVKSKRL